jgi:hypothetical protein
VAIIDGQTPNLWWPEDHSWCVASEIDLSSTYVGGPSGLIEQLVTDERLETVEVQGSEDLTRVEDWVWNWAEKATDSLLAGTEAIVDTPRGILRVQLELPRRRGLRRRRGTLRTRYVGENGVSGNSFSPLRVSDERQLRDDIRRDIAYQIISLVGG